MLIPKGARNIHIILKSEVFSLINRIDILNSNSWIVVFIIIEKRYFVLGSQYHFEGKRNKSGNIQRKRCNKN